ncbi:MAG: hypothetical protein COT55_02350 [Candidatus Diapherotrites archaeon CG09_land_8_20_14_0_10_32_12]|nr:MAG: hypothetical protein COT55_02350 [Candidatus Diapherotrites archaeon CG09_land_8_20_14_0_10_32_12]
MFLDKYEPQSFEGFVGNKQAIIEVRAWAENFDKERKPLLLVGCTGVGKSTIARVISYEKNWQINEISSDEQRDKDSLEKRMELFVQSSSFFNKRNLFVFEDLDFLPVKDSGASSKILEIIKIAKNPVIFTATNIYSSQKIREIVNYCFVVNLKKLTYLEIQKKLKEIIAKEDIYFSESALEIMAKSAKGDIRSAILDLEALADIGVTEKTIAILGEREKTENIFSTLMNLQKSKSLIEGKRIQDSCNIDYDMQFAWVNENISSIYGYPELKKAYDLVSYADLMKNYIYKRQNWIFLKYYLMTGIVAPFMLKNKKFTKFNFPSFISRMSRDRSNFSKNKSIAKLVQKLIRGSSKRILNEIPYYKQYFESTDPEFLQSKYTDSELEDLEKLLKIKFKMPTKEPKAKDKTETKPKDKLNQYLEKSETTLAPTKTPTNAGRGKQVTLF